MEIERPFLPIYHPEEFPELGNKENLLKMEIESVTNELCSENFDRKKQRKSPENGD